MEVFDLKRFRKEKKLTQKQLAEILNCEQPFISKVEKEERLFPESMLSTIKDIYGDITEYITIKEDTVLHGISPQEFMQVGVDAFSRQMVNMMNDKLIAPYGFLEEKDKEIERLNRLIGKLEKELQAYRDNN